MPLLNSITVTLLFAFLAAFTVSRPVAAEEPKMPDTPAGRALAGSIAALNTNDGKTIRAFVDANASPQFLLKAPADRQVDQALFIADDTGGVTLHKVEKSEDFAITALVQARTDKALLRFTLAVEKEAPHKISAFSARKLLPGDEDEGKEPKGKLTDAQIVNGLETLLDKMAQEDRFSGAALIAKDGKVLFKKAYGQASKAYGVANRPDTKFNLGSMNKMFTAVAVAQLVEEGKLSFDDKVGKILPDYPNKQVAEKVTIHHLLTHTSGMGSYFNDKFMDASRARFRTVQDYFPLFVNEPSCV